MSPAAAHILRAALQLRMHSALTSQRTSSDICTQHMQLHNISFCAAYDADMLVRVRSEVPTARCEPSALAYGYSLRAARGGRPTLGSLDVRLCWVDPTASFTGQLQSLLHACFHMLVRYPPSRLLAQSTAHGNCHSSQL